MKKFKKLTAAMLVFGMLLSRVSVFAASTDLSDTSYYTKHF